MDGGSCQMVAGSPRYTRCPGYTRVPGNLGPGYSQNPGCTLGKLYLRMCFDTYPSATPTRRLAEQILLSSYVVNVPIDHDRATGHSPNLRLSAE
jgi:hypothetical protein